MHMTHDQLDAAKRRVVHRVFIDTADDNYIAARWCYFHEVRIDFHWLAVHALEKYLKAMLLLNDEAAKEHGHDIVKLYAKATSIAADLLPDKLEQPKLLDSEDWRDEETELFLKRLYDNGEANNRYDLYGFLQLRHDLFKLDHVVFAVRRLCCRLGEPSWPGGPETGTNREALTAQSESWILDMTGNMEQTFLGKRGSELRKALLDLNTLLATEEFEHSEIQTGISASNSILRKEIVKPLKGTAEKAQQTARDLRDWVIDNIKLPPSTLKDLRDAGP